MDNNLNSLFDELKAKETFAASLADNLSTLEIGDILPVSMPVIVASSIKKAISIASRNTAKDFDFVIDKANGRVLIKRVQDVERENGTMCISRLLKRVEGVIIKSVSKSGMVYQSNLKQRVRRASLWADFVDAGGDQDSLDEIIESLVRSGAIKRSGALISVA